MLQHIQHQVQMKKKRRKYISNKAVIHGREKRRPPSHPPTSEDMTGHR